MRHLMFFCAMLVAAPLSAKASTLNLLTVSNNEQVMAVEPVPGETTALLLSRKGEIEVFDRETGTREVLADLDLPSGPASTYDLAIAPGFETSGTGKVFVSFRTPANQHKVVAYDVTTDANGTINFGNSTQVLSIDHGQMAGPGAHFGGAIDFGQDGMLYVTTGDSDAPITDNPIVSQQLNDQRGKVLRIDPNGDDFPSDTNQNYAIPDDNPNFGPNADPALWAIGLRNPFGATFDPLTGTYIIADVGEDLREEINLGQAGNNYGWNILEGTLPLLGGDDLSGLTPPIFEYSQTDSRSSVTGGLVYYGQLDALDGQYIFGDFVSGRVFSLQPLGGDWTNVSMTEWSLIIDGKVQTLDRIVGFGQDGEGNLYISTLFGSLYQVTMAEVPLLGAFSFLASLWALLWIATGRRKRLNA